MPFHRSQSNLRAYCGGTEKKKPTVRQVLLKTIRSLALILPPSFLGPPPPSPRPCLDAFPWVCGAPQEPGSAARRRAAIPSREKGHSPPPSPATPFRRGKSERTKGQNNKQATTHTAHRSTLALRTGVFCEKEKSAHCDQRGQLTVFTCEAQRQFSFRSISTRKPPLIKKQMLTRPHSAKSGRNNG